MEKFNCISCGALIDMESKVCPHCGEEYEEIKAGKEKKIVRKSNCQTMDSEFQLPVYLISQKAYSCSQSLHTFGTIWFILSLIGCVIMAFLGIILLPLLIYAGILFICSLITKALFDWLSYSLQCLVIIANKK